MRNVIIAKGTTVTESISAYIDKKFNKFNKYLPEDTIVYTKIEIKEGGLRNKVEITISINKKTYRAEANNINMYASIDEAENIMCNLLRKRKDRLVTDKKHKTEEAQIENESEYEIAKFKNYELYAMSTKEACEAMEDVGHPFYVYLDDDDKKIALVYKRKDGTFGKIAYHQ